jgi:hypothetical protein
MNLNEVLKEYEFANADFKSQLLSSGLINATWKITYPDSREFILQRINTTVFKAPELIAQNLENLSEYLSKFNDYLFVNPIKNKNAKTLTIAEDKTAYRIFPFIKNSYTIESVSTPSQE